MTRWGRVARGTVAALLSVFLAGFAHSLAGGALPGIAGIALVVTFSILVCIAFVGRRMPRTRLATSILVSQAMYHWLFGSLGSLEALAPRPGTLGHVHNAPVDFGAIAGQAHDHGDMLMAHVAAAAVTFAIFAFGERSITAIVHAARAFVLSLIPRFADATPITAPARLQAHGTRITVARRDRVDHSGLRHRGPPAFCPA